MRCKPVIADPVALAVSHRLCHRMRSGAAAERRKLFLVSVAEAMSGIIWLNGRNSCEIALSLVDERGNVVGVVSAKLSARVALAASGALPENVNYAVKSSFLLSFLESVPEVSAKLKDANTKERKFEDVVKDAEQAAVLVLVY